jgi:predicted lipoprotein with Yx(FWY)xxD motif
MFRTSICTRSGPALLLCLMAACAHRRTTSTTSSGEVARDTTAAATPPAAVVVAPPDAPPVAVQVPPSADVAVNAPPGTVVALATATAPGVGVVLADSSGRAVYVLDGPDGTPVVACTADCAAAFDPVTGKAVIATGQTGLDPALVGVVTLADGTQQATYNGMPLYYARDDPAGAMRATKDMPAGGAKRAGVTSYRLTPQGKKVGRLAR